MSRDSCPICARGEPADIVARLGASWLTMNERAPARGYACLVSAVHAVELHDLPELTAMQFLRDARAVSKALVDVTGAVKLNYEIHGNTIPHLHIHFYPRYRGDRFEGRPIDPRAIDPPVYADGEFAVIRNGLLAALA